MWFGTLVGRREIVPVFLAWLAVEASLQAVLGKYSAAGDFHDVPSFHSDGGDGAFKRYLGRKRKEHNLLNKEFAYDSAGQSSISLSHN